MQKLPGYSYILEKNQYVYVKEKKVNEVSPPRFDFKSLRKELAGDPEKRPSYNNNNFVNKLFLFFNGGDEGKQNLL